jgi:hypothetical protein
MKLLMLHRIASSLYRFIASVAQLSLQPVEIQKLHQPMDRLGILTLDMVSYNQQNSTNPIHIQG